MSEPGSGNLKKVKDRFSEYEDMEFEKRGEWVLAEDFSGTQLWLGNLGLGGAGRRG